MILEHLCITDRLIDRMFQVLSQVLYRLKLNERKLPLPLVLKV